MLSSVLVSAVYEHRESRAGRLGASEKGEVERKKKKSSHERIPEIALQRVPSVRRAIWVAQGDNPPRFRYPFAIVLSCRYNPDIPCFSGAARTNDTLAVPGKRKASAAVYDSSGRFISYLFSFESFRARANLADNEAAQT